MPPQEGFHRAERTVFVGVHVPTEDGSTNLTTGRLLGAMHMRGALLHYRISLGHGVVLMAPPTWLDRDSRRMVLIAGLSVPADMMDDGPAAWLPAFIQIAPQAAARVSASSASTAPQPAPADRRRAFERGASDFNLGLARAACPYTCARWTDWLDGYEATAAEQHSTDLGGA